MSTQRLSPPSDGENTARKRVCKACDRCRLKKSKCDGSSPCSRCRSDNAICVFGDRKKAHDKIYPKGYVEMLEQQQAQLVKALQEMYRRMTNNEGWKGHLLDTSANGYPLTHDILERLDTLRIDGHLSPDRFEEDTNALQRKFPKDGSLHIKRQSCLESDSDEDGMPPKRRSWPDPVQQMTVNLPPTPPNQSQHLFMTSSPTTYGAAPVLDTMLFPMPHSEWGIPSNMYDHPYGFDPSSPPAHPSHGYVQQQSNPCLPISSEWDEDFGNIAFVNLDTRPNGRSQPTSR